MKVRDIIRELSVFPPDAEVITHDEAMGYCIPVTSVVFEPAGDNADIMVDQVILQTAE